MNSANYFFYDIETTGRTPAKSRIITLSGYVTDAAYKLLGEFHGKFKVGDQRFSKNVFNKDVDLWNPEGSEYEPEKVHGITWEEQRDFPSPTDTYNELMEFLEQWPKDKITLVYHSNTGFDLRFLQHDSMIHNPKVYRYLSRRFSDFTPNEESKEHSIRFQDTMGMAQKYIREGKNVMGQMQRLEKTITKMNNYLTKDRKTPAQPAKIAEWEDKRRIAQKELDSMDTFQVQLKGYSLDKICDSLGVELRHHDAASDAKALIPIHQFLSNSMAI